MRHAWLVALLVFTCTTGESVAQTQVKAAFWNIAWFPGKRPNAYKGEQVRQTKSVHADMLRLDADVIGLEEMRDFASASLAVRPARRVQGRCLLELPAREGTSGSAASRDRQPTAADERVGGRLEGRQRHHAAARLRRSPPTQHAPQRSPLLLPHLKSNLAMLVENVAIREESMPASC
jgi:hypothetical protein